MAMRTYIAHIVLGKVATYATILNALAEKLPHLHESLTEILKQRNLVNVNIGLQLDHLIIYITKEKL